MAAATYVVKGMTCGHCVGSVKGELGELEGVTDVDVDLSTGKVTITSEGDIGADAVRAAVEEAGYEVAS